MISYLLWPVDELVSNIDKLLVVCGHVMHFSTDRPHLLHRFTLSSTLYVVVNCQILLFLTIIVNSIIVGYGIAFLT